MNRIVLASKRTPVLYNDQFFRIILCAISAFLVAMYGSSAHYLDAVSSRSFLVKLLVAMLIAGVFLEFIHWITVRLDRDFDWKDKPIARTFLQSILGILLPGLMDFLFLLLYKWYFGLYSADETSVYQSSLSFMILPVFLFNLYYLLYYHHLRGKEEKSRAKTAQELLLVNQGNKTFPVSLAEVRYIYHRDRINYLVTAGAKEYFLNETLDELEGQLPFRDFFRVNRQIIIHYLACSHFRAYGHGKLLLDLDPKFREEVVVSQARAPKFKEWIRR